MPTKRMSRRLGVEVLGLESRTDPSPLTPRFAPPAFAFVNGTEYAAANGHGTKDAGVNGASGRAEHPGPGGFRPYHGHQRERDGHRVGVEQLDRVERERERVGIWDRLGVGVGFTSIYVGL